MTFNLSVFWFRRDLRLHDNHGFFQALDKSKSVLPIFIFDANILDELNENDRRVSLLFDRIKELNAELAKQDASKHSESSSDDDNSSPQARMAVAFDNIVFA